MKKYGFAVVHIPHASVHIPDDYRRSILLNDEALQAAIALETDAFCDELYAAAGFAHYIIAPVSRFVCDMERFREDENEPCSQRGQGLFYTHTFLGQRIRENDAALRERVLREYYDPHHERLTAAVDRALAQYNKCLIIDGHSFSGIGWENEYPQGLPDFCIGTDDFHTPMALQNALRDLIRSKGYSCELNIPYSGAITPMKHYRKDKRVVSVMIEVHRRLYKHSDKMEKNSAFEKIRTVCAEVMTAAAEIVEKRADNGNEFFIQNGDA